jgi:DNA-binding winged helix-turn-helix (wHTH) protein
MAAGMTATPSGSHRLYRFADFTLSPAQRLLRRHGREVPLIPRYLDLLLLLVERRGEALHRHEILDRVWSDVVVSDGALTQAVRTLRRALGEDGDRPAFIRTVSRHGYQFVCPVAEEDEGPPPSASSSAGPTSAAADAPPPASSRPPATGVATLPAAAEGPAPSDLRDAALARLLAPDGTDDMREEAAVELHRLGTAEALRRIDRQPGHARAWAHLRDARWDVAEAGAVSLLEPPASPAGWLALVLLRLRRALRLVAARWASASAGAAAAGLAAGLLGSLAIAALDGRGLPSPSLLLGLGLVGAGVAGVGAAGVGSGLAAAEALVRSRRTPALVLFGAAGGALVAFIARRGVDALLDGLFGFPPLPLGGGLEGLAIGAAAGLGYGLSTRRPGGGMATPRGDARLRVCGATAVACALAAGLVSAAGLRLGSTSLAAVVRGFPATQVHLAALGRLVGEAGLGPHTRALLGAFEGLLFGAGLAAGLTRRPRWIGRDTG